MKREQLISQLREEASNVKDCFTKFSFQAIAISVVYLGFVFKFQNESPEISVCSLIIMVFALMIAKIGNHKYNTANRNLGFLLFLERRDLIYKNNCKIFRDEDEIAWEEAMRAWRIVQATVFNEIYRTNWFLPNKIKIGKKSTSNNNSLDCLWFEPKCIVQKENAYYYPGSYLRNMHLMLFFIAFNALIPPIVAIFQEYHHDIVSAVILFIITILSFFYFLWRIMRLSTRRRILEQELLSIHSSAILWEAVVLAYNIAISKSKNDAMTNDKHPLGTFTIHLAQISTDLANKIDNIYKWIQEKQNDL